MDKILGQCFALRAYISPHRLLRLNGGRPAEYISYPFPMYDTDDIGVMLRLRAGDPTSMVEWRLPESMVSLLLAGANGVGQ